MSENVKILEVYSWHNSSWVLIKMSRYSNNMTDTPLKIQGESISEFEYINNCFKGLGK